MFRSTVARLLSVVSTSVPSNFTAPVDMAFYYPRFQPATHIVDMGIAEIKDAVAMLQGPENTIAGYTASATDDSAFLRQIRWSTSVARPGTKSESPDQLADRLKAREKGLLALERGIDILESLGGPCSTNAAIPNMIRPLYAARFELINGSEHLPRPEYAKHQHVQRSILHQSARLLFYDNAWDKSDVKQIDTSLVILAHFVKAFCALHPRPFNAGPAVAAKKSAASGLGVKSSGKSSSGDKVNHHASATVHAAAAKGLFNSKAWALQIPNEQDFSGNSSSSSSETRVLTLAMVMDRIDEAIRMAVAAHKKYGAEYPELRWHEPKLLLLKALMTIPHSGNLAIASDLALKACEKVVRMKEHRNRMLDGLKGIELEPETGLYRLFHAQLLARSFDWDVPEGRVDLAVVRAFEESAKSFSSPLITALDADGIASEKTAPEHLFEVQAHACALVCYARFMLDAPRPKGTGTRDTPVFLRKQMFSLDPAESVATSSNVIFSDVRETGELTLEECRRRSGQSLIRALEINRKVLPENKENPLAAWTLLGMACMYADTRDYLYATGLFESAHKSFVANYGTTSMENVLLQRLKYEFMAGVGSELEAKTASHEVVSLLKRIDKLPGAQ